jgi:hypothetical protein
MQARCAAASASERSRVRRPASGAAGQQPAPDCRKPTSRGHGKQATNRRQCLSDGSLAAKAARWLFRSRYSFSHECESAVRTRSGAILQIFRRGARHLREALHTHAYRPVHA